MFLRRDFLIKKQLEENKKSNKNPPIDSNTMSVMKARALEQLTMSRIKNREMQFHKI